MDSQNDDKARELEELRTRMMKENMFLRYPYVWLIGRTSQCRCINQGFKSL